MAACRGALNGLMAKVIEGHIQSHVLNPKSGLELVHSHTWSKDGVPTGMHFFMGSVMLLAAAGDIRMLVRGGVFGAKRIVRHLWRMCFGFFIATGSFFLGQQQVFPAWLRGSSVLFIPALSPLVLLIFWLFRLRFTNAYKRMSMPRGDDVFSLPRPARDPDAGC